MSSGRESGALAPPIEPRLAITGAATFRYVAATPLNTVAIGSRHAMLVKVSSAASV